MAQLKKPKKIDRNKRSYVCPKCSIKVWGKPDLGIKCLGCEAILKEAS